MSKSSGATRAQKTSTSMGGNPNGSDKGFDMSMLRSYGLTQGDLETFEQDKGDSKYISYLERRIKTEAENQAREEGISYQQDEQNRFQRAHESSLDAARTADERASITKDYLEKEKELKRKIKEERAKIEAKYDKLAEQRIKNLRKIVAS